MRDKIFAITPPHDILLALSTLSRLPVRVDHTQAANRGVNMVWAFPLVGAVIGLIASGVAAALQALFLPSGFLAALILATMIACTGAMHEDGLADTFDGLWGGFTPERRLEIMKDSRIGVYGMLALCLMVLAQWSLLEPLSATTLIGPLIVTATLSRLAMVWAMWLLPNARQDGLSASFGRPDFSYVAIATLLALGIAVISLGWVGLLIALVALGTALPILLIAWYKIEGQTGDILGASQKFAELGALIAIISI